jgi:hypothetical protein
MESNAFDIQLNSKYIENINNFSLQHKEEISLNYYYKIAFNF